ncbi:MAG: transketolase, partial [Bacteroidota bacterium]|nr:transketolase [Bacteroidota bacterium]
MLSLDELAVNTIRFLSVDGVQKANSGHPGMPMGCAPIAYSLYTKFLKHNPSNPKWINRDRFVLSAGHGSMLLYSILHLCGYDISLDDLKNFRQWGSKTPGHPENTHTPGVETTTGPLGQGFANAVGMALAEAHLAARFNKENYNVIDNYTYGICGDGDLMEGISHEAASFAGNLKLGKLIFFYDNNNITIDGKATITCSDNVRMRFEAYGWNVQHVKDVNDLSAIEDAVKSAQAVKDKPSLIITDTHIGYGSPNKQDSSSAHGSPLGVEEVKLAKQKLGWDPEKFFYVPDEVSKVFAHVKPQGMEKEAEWNKLFEDYKKNYPAEAGELLKIVNADYGNDWVNNLPEFKDEGKGIATRVASQTVINAIAKYIPGFIGGSADLAASNNTTAKEFGFISPEDYSGRNIHFGIREHGMAAILNGLSLYAGFVGYGATFLIFSEYLRPAIRMASLAGVRPIYVFTHDSIGLGEDGPTHQPVEQLAALRAIPYLTVIRPCDANETAQAWKAAVQQKAAPVALILSRQGLPVLDRTKYASHKNLEKGAYILRDSVTEPDLILLASGSEVHICLKAAEIIEKEGVNVRVVSFPSWELFEKQSKDYKDSVLLPSVKSRISVEAGIKMGWQKYVGDLGESVSIETF